MNRDIITVRVTVQRSQSLSVDSAIRQLTGFGYYMNYTSIGTLWEIRADREAIEALTDWMQNKA